MSLIGKSVLGSPFLQDPKAEWLKLNGVVLGESKKFSYQTTRSRDIGSLLDRLIKDSSIVCVLYNWKTGFAYTKTGFDLNDKNDYHRNEDFTTFIVKERIPQSSLPTPPTPPISVSKFVKWGNKTFVVEGKTFHPVGPNVYWLGYTENNDYPKQSQVIEMFEIAKMMKSTVIRSHTLGISSGNSNALRPYNNTLNENAWDSIDFAFHTAKQYDIKLICPLTDAYSWANGNYGDFCKTRGVAKHDFWTNRDVRKDFKDFIYKWLNHTNKYDNVMIKDNPTLAFIELGNEFNIRPDADSTTFPPEDWLRDITEYIKSIDSNHLVMDGTDEELGKSNNFNITTIDCFTGHFYGQDITRLKYGASSAMKAGKPYIVGEYSGHFGDDWYNVIETTPNVVGSVFWNLYPHQNGSSGGGKVDHQDGETLWYPEDRDHLLRISNHFRRLQGLPVVNDLT